MSRAPPRDKSFIPLNNKDLGAFHTTVEAQHLPSVRSNASFSARTDNPSDIPLYATSDTRPRHSWQTD